MKKKILITIGNFWYPAVVSTGIISIYYLAKELNKNNEVHILTNKNIWEKDLLGSSFYNFTKVQQEWNLKTGLKIHYVKNKIAKFLPKFAYLINKLIYPISVYKINKKHDFDTIIEITSNPILLFRTLLIQLFFKKKIIHVFLAIANSGFISNKIIKIISKSNIKLIFTNKYYYQKYQDIINDEKIAYIPVGFHIEKEEINKFREIALDKNKINIGYFGPLRKYKGIETLAKSINLYNKKVRKNNICFYYITIKLGTESEHKNNLKNIKILKNVKIYEGLVNKDKLFKKIDYLVFPQNQIDGSTGHPVTLLEAMNYGVTTISSDIEGINEIIIDNENGYLFKINDYRDLTNIFIKINNHKIKKINQKKIKKRAGNYRIKNLALKYEKII